MPGHGLKLGRALRHRNFRLYFTGQGISLIGTWLTRFAIGYATYVLSHSTWQLGLVSFFSQAPTSLIAPIAGALVDRWNRHRTIVITQVFALAQSSALAAFAITGTLTVWHLMVLGAIQAVINAFDMPARQSFLRQMVEDRADLPNAIALNSSLFNGARIAGPTIAAALVSLVGIGWCFAIDAASFLAVIVSLVIMNVPPQPVRPPTSHGVLGEIRDGLRYVYGLPLVFGLLLLLTVTSTLGGAYASLLPAVAGDTFGGGARELGWLMGAGGAGALVGALYLANGTKIARLPAIAARCGIWLGAGLIALELAPSVWIAVPMLFVVGLAIIVMWAATNTLVQTLVDDAMLGRVMSLYAMAFFAGAPIGALVEGALARVVGPIHALALAGVGCLACGLAFRRALPRLEARTRALGVTF
ncbi:MAG TPA: MFS transporter [Kofleriaceae bacterium]|nr:MFS transporter [Kofleriaceae bacterium]